MKILGIDHGTQRIGLAISDEAESMALAYGVVEGGIDAVVSAVQESGAQAIVVGMPKNMNDSIGPAGRRVKQFVEQLRERTKLPVDTFDERLTSYEAEQKLIGAPLSRKKKKAHVNVVAAQLILEGYLRLRGPSGRPGGGGKG
jgi:putative Holliday junction resolvase